MVHIGYVKQVQLDTGILPVIHMSINHDEFISTNLTDSLSYEYIALAYFAIFGC